MLLLRPISDAGAQPTPGEREIPAILARIAWRGSLTDLPWDGSTTSGWVTDGTAISGPVSSLDVIGSDSFGGGSAFEMVTAGTAASGIDYPLPGTFVADRPYRMRAGVRNVSGDTSLVLRLGNASDFAASTATTTTGWTWYTVDWTPSAQRTDAVASLQNGSAATQTTRLDHVEVHEAADEVTLQDLRVTRGSRFDGGAEPPGTIHLEFLDPSQTYTPNNQASGLYPNIVPGRRLHIRASYGGRLYPVAYGVIRSITPDPRRRVVVITAEDGLRELERYSVYRAFDSDGVYHTSRAAALSAEALASTMHDLTMDSIESNVFDDGTSESVLLKGYLERLNEATGTIHVCVPHVEAARPWRYTTIPRTVLTQNAAGVPIDEDFQDLDDPTIHDEALVTRQVVRWTSHERLSSRTVAVATPESEDGTWAYAADDYGFGGARFMPLHLEANESRALFINFLWPMEDLTAAVTASGSATSSVRAWSESARLTITAGGTAIDVTNITWTAAPSRPVGEQEAAATASVELVVAEGRPLSNPYIVREPAAKGLADYTVWRYGTARMRPSIIDQHRPVRQLTTGVGSLVSLSADRWLIDTEPYIVRDITHEISGAGHSWVTTYGLEAAVSGTWVVLDAGPTYGLDGSATLAY